MSSIKRLKNMSTLCPRCGHKVKAKHNACSQCGKRGASEAARIAARATYSGRGAPAPPVTKAAAGPPAGYPSRTAAVRSSATAAAAAADAVASAARTAQILARGRTLINGSAVPFIVKADALRRELPAQNATFLRDFYREPDPARREIYWTLAHPQLTEAARVRP